MQGDTPGIPPPIYGVAHTIYELLIIILHTTDYFNFAAATKIKRDGGRKNNLESNSTLTCKHVLVAELAKSICNAARANGAENARQESTRGRHEVHFVPFKY